MPETYTLAELDKHRSKDSCWMAIEGKVYDVTNFLDEHPGGEDFLLDNAGTHSIPHTKYTHTLSILLN